MSTLLVGTQTSFTGKIVTLANETAVAVPVTGGVGGTLSALDFRTGSNASTALSLKVALVKAVEGKPPTGAPTVVASAKIPLSGSTAANTWLSEVASWESFVQNEEIVAGAAYFWIVVPLGGNICLRYEKTEGGTHTWKHTTANVTEATATISWVENAETPGPLDMRGLGSPAGQVPTAAAASTSAASLSLTIRTPLPLAAAASSSAAANAVTVPTQIPLEPASSSSSDFGSLGHPAKLEPGAAASTSAASAAPTAATRVALEAAASASASAGTIGTRFPTPIPLSAAASTSAAALAVYSGLEVPYGPEPKQVTDVFTGAVANSPMVLFVHGGGWTKDQLATVRADAKNFWLTSGFCTFNVNYRDATSTVGSFPMQLEDIEAAVNFAIAHAATYNGNPSRIFIVAGSAGAHLSALVAERMNAVSPVIRGVATLSGIFDLKLMVEQMETGEYREEPWPARTDGVLTNVGGAGFLESATANFTSAMVGYIVGAPGKIPSKSVIKSVISPTKVELSLENTLTGSGVTFTTQRAGGTVNTLTENVQEALQQNMHYVGPYAGEPGVTPPNSGNPATNLTASREAQTLYSPSRQAVPKGCRWYLFNVVGEEDLIPANQWEAMQAHLNAEARPVKVGLIEGAFAPGHAFSYWAARVGGKLIAEVIQSWIEEPEAAIVLPAPAASTSAAGVTVGTRISVQPAPAASASAAATAVTVPSRLPLAVAASQSAASAAVAVKTQVPLAPAASSAGATAAVSIPTLVPLAPAVSTSSTTGTIIHTVNFPSAVPVAGSVAGAQRGRIAQYEPEGVA